MKQNITHRNHYVPQFYLKNWSYDGKTIQVYSILVSDPKVPYWTTQSIKNTAVWNDFYTRMEGENEIDDFERWFNCEFETPAEPIFKKLLSDIPLSNDEKIILSHFVFAQYIRTPAHFVEVMKLSKEIFPKSVRETIENLPKAIKSNKTCISTTKSEGENLFPLKVSLDRENRIAKIRAVIGKGLYLHTLKHQLSETLKVAEYLNWKVIHAGGNVSFPTSDDPVICLNFRNRNDYDFNGGWKRKNCDILMPISPNMILFAEVGKKGDLDFLDYSSEHSLLFREMIIKHAYRYVYAEKRQRGMLALNPRIVRRELFEQEKESMSGWHTEQMQAEKELYDLK